MTRTKTRALANWPNNAVSVLDFGAVGDGVTDDRAAIQACIDATDSGTIVFPEGNYYLTPSSQTGSGIVQSVTGSSFDSPDFVALNITQKKNIVFEGANATLTCNRGVVFFVLLGERLTFRGLNIINPNSNLDPGLVRPDNYEPSAIQINYSVDCTIENCKAVGQSRGFDFRRSNSCSALNNIVSDNFYLGISSYGTLYQPPSWTFTDLVDYFPTEYLRDAGIIYSNNRVYDFGYVGLYASNTATITSNTVSNPIDITYDSGVRNKGISGIQASGSYISIIGNSLEAKVLPSMQSEVLDNNYTAISSKLEDIADGSTSTDLIISNNRIVGCAYGINTGEIENSIVSNNSIYNWTRGGINILCSEGIGSNVINTSFTGNVIGAANTATKAVATTYNYVGGIVLSTQGSNYTAQGISITDNYFNIKAADIVDTNSREEISKCILFNATGPNVYNNNIANNTLIVSGPEILSIGNKEPFNVGTNNIIDLDSDISYPDYQVNDSITFVAVNGDDKTITLPNIGESIMPGSSITVINRYASDVTIQAGSNSFINGQTNQVVNNSAVTLVCTLSSVTGTLVYWEMISNVDYSTVYSITVEEQKLRDVSTNEEQGN